MAREPQSIRRVVLVCTGSRCKKAGAKTIAKEVRRCVKSLALKKTTLVVRTRCNGMCDEGPLVSLQPDNIWLMRTTPETTRRAILERYAENLTVLSMRRADSPAGSENTVRRVPPGEA